MRQSLYYSMIASVIESPLAARLARTRQLSLRRNRIVLLAIAGLMLFSTSPALALPPVRHCSGSFDNSGRYHRTLNFWSHFSERGTTCGRALSVGHQYIVDNGTDGDGDQIGRWACRFQARTFNDIDHTPYGVVGCSAHGGLRITFYGIS